MKFLTSKQTFDLLFKLPCLTFYLIANILVKKADGTYFLDAVENAKLWRMEVQKRGIRKEVPEHH